MFAPHQLKIAKGIGRFEPVGRATLVDAVDLVTGAIGFCRQNGISKLLVNANQLRGLPVPTTVDRFLMAREWADASQGAVTVAIVVASEYVDPERFGVKAAADAGLTAGVFTSEAEAGEWLNGSP
jgi:hypothetical protein